MVDPAFNVTVLQAKEMGSAAQQDWVTGTGPQ
jgi:hypothetical protein